MNNEERTIINEMTQNYYKVKYITRVGNLYKSFQASNNLMIWQSYLHYFLIKFEVNLDNVFDGKVFKNTNY